MTWRHAVAARRSCTRTILISCSEEETNNDEEESFLSEYDKCSAYKLRQICLLFFTLSNPNVYKIFPMHNFYIDFPINKVIMDPI